MNIKIITKACQNLSNQGVSPYAPTFQSRLQDEIKILLKNS